MDTIAYPMHFPQKGAAMNPVISHMSALKYQDRCARIASLKWNDDMPTPCANAATIDFAYTKRQLKPYDFSRFEKLVKPIDLLVPSNIHAHAPKGFKFHGAGATLPEGALLNAGDGILIASPPLIYVQLCRGISFMRCIKLGNYICGVYSPEPTARSGVVERKQLATKEELERFMLAASSLYGSRQARKALPWILDNAASPQETELALPFYLPAEQGGKGFILPTLNYEVKLSPKERTQTGKKCFRIDVCWPEQKIGFEYNSYAEHSSERKIGEDEQRKLILQSKGYRIELVSKQQLDDPTQVAYLAQLLDDAGVPRAV